MISPSLTSLSGALIRGIQYGFGSPPPLKWEELPHLRILDPSWPIAPSQALKDSRVKVRASQTRHEAPPCFLQLTSATYYSGINELRQRKNKRRVANTLAPKSNHYQVLQITRGVGYYKDLFPPLPQEMPAPLVQGTFCIWQPRAMTFLLWAILFTISRIDGN